MSSFLRGPPVHTPTQHVSCCEVEHKAPGCVHDDGAPAHTKGQQKYDDTAVGGYAQHARTTQAQQMIQSRKPLLITTYIGLFPGRSQSNTHPCGPGRHMSHPPGTLVLHLTHSTPAEAQHEGHMRACAGNRCQTQPAMLLPLRAGSTRIGVHTRYTRGGWAGLGEQRQPTHRVITWNRPGPIRHDLEIGQWRPPAWPVRQRRQEFYNSSCGNRHRKGHHLTPAPHFKALCKPTWAHQSLAGPQLAVPELQQPPSSQRQNHALLPSCRGCKER